LILFVAPTFNISYSGIIYGQAKIIIEITVVINILGDFIGFFQGNSF